MRTSARLLDVSHRWLGIGGCLLVLMWFLTGMVMIYVPFPELTPERRLAGASPLAAEAVLVGPAAAWAATGLEGFPHAVRLIAIDGRAAYCFQAGGRWHSVWADSGEARAAVTRSEALQVAEAFAGRRAEHGDAELLERDQWTVYRKYDPHRPLLRVALGDAAGSEFHVSSRTGEVVLETSRFERGWNWVGTVLHWLYFTPLRMHGEVWRQLVMWLSVACLALAITGVWLGVQRVRIAPRYRSGRITPYRGWKRWHHLLGLTAAVWTCTWLASGWLSLTPMGWFESGGPSESDLRRFSGVARLDLSAEPALLRALLAAHPAARELQWSAFGGRATIELHAAGGVTLVNMQGDVLSPLAPQAIAGAVAGLGNGRVARVDLLTRGDLYHYAHRSQAVILPVVRVAVTEGTAYYVDPASGRLLLRLDDGARAWRWLFSALHRLDVPPLEGHALWEVVVIVMCALGAALAATGVVLALRHLRRAARVRQEPVSPAAQAEPRPHQAAH